MTAAASSAASRARSPLPATIPLIVERESLPATLEISAWTAEGEIMGLRHKTLAVDGVQFHPESILTIEGKSLLQNFLDSLPKNAKAA